MHTSKAHILICITECVRGAQSFFYDFYGNTKWAFMALPFQVLSLALILPIELVLFFRFLSVSFCFCQANISLLFSFVSVTIYTIIIHMTDVRHTLNLSNQLRKTNKPIFVTPVSVVMCVFVLKVSFLLIRMAFNGIFYSFCFFFLNIKFCLAIWPITKMDTSDMLFIYTQKTESINAI